MDYFRPLDGGIMKKKKKKMIFCFDFRVIKEGDKTENEIIFNFYLEKIVSELWTFFFFF